MAVTSGKSRLKAIVQDWRFRHLGSLVLATILVLAFAALRPDWSPMHKWNRAFADASIVLIAAVMLVGPLSRLWRKANALIPWRRELGVWGVLASFVHFGFILFGWVELEWQRLFGLVFHPDLQYYVMFDKGFGLANVIGIVAMLYALVLALSSNDFSQRWMSMPVWKFIQQSAYILWALIVAHTAYFLFIHFLDFHRQTPEPNILQAAFVGLVIVTYGVQYLASLRTWKTRKQRRSAERANG